VLRLGELLVRGRDLHPVSMLGKGTGIGKITYSRVELGSDLGSLPGRVRMRLGGHFAADLGGGFVGIA
jgi:hypothetical protein